MTKSIFSWVLRSGLNIGIPYFIIFLAQQSKEYDILHLMPIIFFCNVLLGVGRSATLVSILNKYARWSKLNIFIYHYVILMLIFLPISMMDMLDYGFFVILIMLFNLGLSSVSSAFGVFTEKNQGLSHNSTVESVVSLFVFISIFFVFIIDQLSVHILFLIFTLREAFYLLLIVKASRTDSVLQEITKSPSSESKPIPIGELLLFSFYWGFPILKDTLLNSFIGNMIDSYSFGNIFSYQIVLGVPSLFMAMLIRPFVSNADFSWKDIDKRLFIIYYLVVFIYPMFYWLYLDDKSISLVYFYLLSMSNYISPFVAIFTAILLLNGKSHYALFQNVLWLVAPIATLILFKGLSPWQSMVCVTVSSNLATLFTFFYFYLYFAKKI
ncbi:TPA: hypothetical protein NVH30_002873 [Vibrio cholerae]|nr:hypothetical protein [Vibrio cholerae]HCJ7279800.1 hypothetical protein [Vibrio cholerae]HCJ7318177.1 hypothetical protein [Vibrio cholerae]